MRRWLRVATIATSVVVVGTAFAVVPMPLASFSPGDATAVDDLIAVPDAATQVDGELRLLSVYVAQPSMFGVLRGAIDDTIELLPRADVFPSDVRRVDYQELQREDFRTSFRIAAAIGLQAAGLEVSIDTVARVAAVVEDGPADGLLLPGDLVVAFDGVPMASGEALVEAAGTTVVGQLLELEVQRGDAMRTVEVVADVLPNTEQVGIGISVETVERELELPLDVQLVDQQSIGGPSAGLMVALTVFDLVSDVDLAAGRDIAGTGTLDGEGRVGRIGGVREKTFAAVEDGVDLVLVPSSQAAEARAAAAGRVEVIGVDTFEDALEALR